MSRHKKNNSKIRYLWYLLPIFFGLVGGILGYMILRKMNKDIAQGLLIVSIVTIPLFYGIFKAVDLTIPVPAMGLASFIGT
ncbi:MAG: hypothetical protein OIN86_13010 [Candidatus Methanoperedens sp.]|nr:hypothetical protein [Candidatus Methanoperedens sp.]CAG0948791.1 hypothetical protein METP1_00057 [Methanosarcinales archaeon]